MKVAVNLFSYTTEDSLEHFSTSAYVVSANTPIIQSSSHAVMHPCIQTAMKSYNHLVIQASRHQASEQTSKQANSIKKLEKEGGGPKVLSGAFVV